MLFCHLKPIFKIMYQRRVSELTDSNNVHASNFAFEIIQSRQIEFPEFCKGQVIYVNYAKRRTIVCLLYTCKQNRCHKNWQALPCAIIGSTCTNCVTWSQLNRILHAFLRRDHTQRLMVVCIFCIAAGQR